MIAHIAASTGWTWDYIADNIDLPRAQSLSKYWQQHPPVHILLAAYVGYTAPTLGNPNEQDALPAQTLSEDEFNQLLKEKGLL